VYREAKDLVFKMSGYFEQEAEIGGLVYVITQVSRAHSWCMWQRRNVVALSLCARIRLPV